MYFFIGLFRLLTSFFLPEIASLPYCFFKKHIFRNCYRCSNYFCKKYNTCYYIEKTLLDIPQKRYFDFLWWIISFFVIIILVFIYYILEVLYGC